MEQKKIFGLAIRVMRGAFIGAGAAALLSTLCGILIVRGVIGAEYGNVMAACCAALAAFAAALAVGKRAGWRMERLLSGAVLLLLLLLIHALAFANVSYQPQTTLLTVIAAAGVSCVLPDGGRRTRRKYR